jgi:carbon-monoxide dehydrogenase small subunit
VALPVSDRRIALETTVNGRAVSLAIAPESLLLDVLRERLGLTGTKRSCDVQVCGACTVLLDGRPVSACSVLAYEARGRQVRTIEGLAEDGRLHPVQEAFLTRSAFQCGFCTPGMIVTVTALLEEAPGASPDEVREYLRGNICRCTGYADILAAVADVQRARPGMPGAGPDPAPGDPR